MVRRRLKLRENFHLQFPCGSAIAAITLLCVFWAKRVSATRQSGNGNNYRALVIVYQSVIYASFYIPMENTVVSQFLNTPSGARLREANERSGTLGRVSTPAPVEVLIVLD